MKSSIPYIFLAALAAAAIAGCSRQPEERSLKRDGSVDVTMETRHLDSLRDVLHTRHVVYSHGAALKQFDRYDTIPSLGSFNTEGEDDDGNTTQLRIPKDYEIYVSTK